MSKPLPPPALPPLPPLPPPRPDDGGEEFRRMTLGYHGDVWPATASHPQPHRKSLRSQSDELLTSQLESELEGSDIDASGVEVKVVGGAVQLEGAVADARAMRTAVEIAEKLLGVESVYNGLQVTQKQ